jgi:hypothetical protein
MNLDRSHLKWAVAVLALAGLATLAYLHTPPGETGCQRSGLVFAASGAGSVIFAAFLPIGRMLARRRPLQILQRGHIWFGLLSLPLALFHSGFRMGGPLTSVLLVMLSATLLSGGTGLLFRHLLPLCKEGRSGRAKLAGTIISAGHTLTLLLHIPLAVALLVLMAFHAVMALYF